MKYTLGDRSSLTAPASEMKYTAPDAGCPASEMKYTLGNCFSLTAPASEMKYTAPDAGCPASEMKYTLGNRFSLTAPASEMKCTAPDAGCPALEHKYCPQFVLIRHSTVYFYQGVFNDFTHAFIPTWLKLLVVCP
jgi:hypothetical protein